MNESREGLNYNEMKDELQALRKKLENLENKQAALQVGAHPTARRKFSRRLITASISLAVLLVVCGGLLWGQQTQALFIAQNGNASLSNDLSLGGKLMSKGLEIGNSELVFTDADHPNSEAGMQLGHAAIFNDSTTNALIIRGRNSPASPGNRNVLISDNLRVEQNLQVGAREDTGLLKAGNATIYNSLAVGTINVLDPAKGLTVNGNATITGTLNGEKQPFRLTIQAEGTRWHSAVVNLKDLCGDDDGCHIKLLMQHKNLNSNVSVRVRAADIFMVQQGANGPIRGYTRSNTGDAQQVWTLNDGSNAQLLEGWGDWMTLTNTYHPEDSFCGGKVAQSSSTPAVCSQSRPYGTGQNNWRNGEDSYLVAFRFHPDITATILIYDR